MMDDLEDGARKCMGSSSSEVQVSLVRELFLRWLQAQPLEKISRPADERDR
jgi:hypothetical protein